MTAAVPLPAPAPVPDGTRAATFADLTVLIKQAGLLQRRPGAYAAVLAGNAVLAAVAVGAFVVLGASWWQLLTAVLFGLVWTQLAFVGHDAGHRQVFTSRRAQRRPRLRARRPDRDELRLLGRPAQRAPRAPQPRRRRSRHRHPRARVQRRAGRDAPGRGALDRGPPGRDVRAPAVPRGLEPARHRGAQRLPRSGAPARARDHAAGHPRRPLRRGGVRRAHPAPGRGVHRRPPGRLGPDDGPGVRPEPQGHADGPGRHRARPPAQAGADRPQRARRAADRLPLRRAQPPGRAPPLPPHAPPEPAGRPGDRGALLPRARVALHRDGPPQLLRAESCATSTTRPPSCAPRRPEPGPGRVRAARGRGRW